MMDKNILSIKRGFVKNEEIYLLQLNPNILKTLHREGENDKIIKNIFFKKGSYML